MLTTGRNVAEQTARTLAKIDSRVHEVIDRLDALNSCQNFMHTFESSKLIELIRYTRRRPQEMALTDKPRNLSASKLQAMVIAKWQLATTREGV